MFYLLFLLTCGAFTAHLVLLDRLQKFRLQPIKRSLQAFFTKEGALYRPANYSIDARDIYRWVVLSGIVTMVLALFTARVLDT